MTEQSSRLPFSLDPLMAEAKQRMRKRRFLIAVLLGLGFGLGAAFGLQFFPNGAGPGGPPNSARGWLSNQVSQVQHAFGGGYIASATVQGRVLTVNLSAAGGVANEVGGFEALVLGYRVADWMRAHRHRPVTNVYVVGPGGRSAGYGDGYPGAPLGRDASPPLRSGACEGVSKHLPPSILAVYDRTLPDAGGVCILKVQTSVQTSKGLRKVWGTVSSALSDAVPTRSEHPQLVEIDNSTGIPQVIGTWFPGLGAYPGVGSGRGSDYERPGIYVIGHN